MPLGASRTAILAALPRERSITQTYGEEGFGCPRVNRYSTLKLIRMPVGPVCGRATPVESRIGGWGVGVAGGVTGGGETCGGGGCLQGLGATAGGATGVSAGFTPGGVPPGGVAEPGEGGCHDGGEGADAEAGAGGGGGGGGGGGAGVAESAVRSPASSTADRPVLPSSSIGQPVKSSTAGRSAAANIAIEYETRFMVFP